MESHRRHIRRHAPELTRKPLRWKRYALVSAVAGISWLVLGSSSAPARAPEVAACDLEKWERIAADLEGVANPRALLGIGRDEELEEILLREGIEPAAFALAARRAVALEASSSADDACRAPLIEVLQTLSIPEGVELPPTPAPIEASAPTSASELAGRLLLATRGGHDGESP